MKILMPARILDRHVGGNTTYSRRIEQGLLVAGHEVGRIPMANGPLGTLALESLAALQRGAGTEILHYVADTGPLFPSRRPMAVTVHGIASRWVDNVRSNSQEAIWRFRVKNAIRHADRVITVSNSSSNDIQEMFGIHEDQIRVIPHGIDHHKFTNIESLSAPVKELLPREYALYLGNIEPRKNLLQLIEAFQSPEIKSLNIPLVIAGKPAWNFRETMAAIEEASNVIYLGFVSDTDRTALMQKCSVFLFPSLYEGFGFPVLEALTAGAVVAASRRGSLAEVSGPSLELDLTTIDSLSASVHSSLTDSKMRARCIRDGLEWASNFSWDASVSAHIEVYGELMS